MILEIGLYQTIALKQARYNQKNRFYFMFFESLLKFHSWCIDIHTHEAEQTIKSV